MGFSKSTDTILVVNRVSDILESLEPFVESEQSCLVLIRVGIKVSIPGRVESILETVPLRQNEVFIQLHFAAFKWDRLIDVPLIFLIAIVGDVGTLCSFYFKGKYYHNIREGQSTLTSKGERDNLPSRESRIPSQVGLGLNYPFLKDKEEVFD